MFTQEALIEKFMLQVDFLPFSHPLFFSNTFIIKEVHAFYYCAMLLAAVFLSLVAADK